MRRLFIFDYDDTLANYPVYNSLVYKLPVKLLPPAGGLMDGVEEVLDEIKSRGDRLRMLTMNILMDEETKWKKLHYVGITRWFAERHVHMVRHKTPEKMLELCGGTGKDRCYMVGNSFRHDIMPALDAGIKAVYIPRPGYKRFLLGRLPDHENLIVLNDIGKVLDIYDGL